MTMPPARRPAIPDDDFEATEQLVSEVAERLSRTPKVVPDRRMLESQRTRIEPAFEATRPNRIDMSKNGALFKRAINAAWLAHHNGEAVNTTTIQMYDHGLPEISLLELMETPLFLQAMEDRGIPTTPATFLTERQIGALAVLSDHTIRKPERTKLNSIGISQTEFQGWLATPIFRRQYRALHERTLQHATERGDTVLAQLIDDGNMRAIEYSNAMTGRYDPATRQAVNVARILGMVVSIVQKHVTDEATLMRLSEDFGQLAVSGGLGILEIEEVPQERPGTSS